jgi:hypothetical protein
VRRVVRQVAVAEFSPKVVIRTHAPARAWILSISLVVAVVVGGYLLFEYGRARAGFDQLAALRARAELRREIEKRDQTIQSLRGDSAALETMRTSQVQERAELSRTIGELQAEVAKQAQQLAFYQGIVAQSANAAEVKLQQFRIGPGASERQFVIRLTLVQTGRPDRTVAGTVTVVAEGVRAGAPATLSLGDLTGGATGQLPYSFRYFENLNPEIVIPADFRPERITVEVRSSRREVAPVTQTFIWALDAA